jgi:hypothetical protein
MSTNSTQFFNTKQPQPQQRSLLGKAWDGTKWAVGGALWGITRPVAWAFNPIGDGLGTGLASGVKKEIEEMVKPDGPLISQLQGSVEQALLKQPPQELLQLKELIKKALEDTDHLSRDDVRFIDAHLKLLFNDQSKLLKLLAPDLSSEGVGLFQKVAKLFKDAVENPQFGSEHGVIDQFKQNLANTSKQDIQSFDAVFNAILDRNQGALIHAMSFLQQALLADEQGILSQAVEVLKNKATDENSGLIKTIIGQLTQLLDKKDGPLDLLTNRLTVGEQSIIAQAILLLKEKLLEKGGVVDEIGKRFTDEKDGIIANALAIAKKNIDETLQSGLVLLKTELTSETGLMATLKKQVSGNDDSILKQAISLLNSSLYDPVDGIVPKLRRELTSEEKGILVDALKLFGKALNDEKEGILAKAIELLRRKLSDKDGVLEEALRLLEQKLNGKGGVVENLQHRLINDQDGALIQALDLLQAKLNDEKTGVLSKALQLLEKRLLAEDGIIGALEKKLTEEETGTLAKAIESMKIALEKKDGPLDLLDQRVQKLLADSLALVQKKCLDDKEGLLAQTLELTTQKLNAENGLLDTLSKRLNDPKEGIIAKSVETLNTKLLDEKEGILTQAIELLKRKLSEKDGVLEEALRLLEQKLNGQGGIVENLEHRLINEHDGALIKALDLLQAKLNDEKTGILSQTLQLLENRLLAENGLIDVLEKKLTEEETGTLAKAIESMKIALEKKDGPLDLLDQRVQKLLADSLALVQKKCLDDKEGLLAQTLELTTQKLNAENGLLDTLSKRLNDPQDGIIAKAIETLNTTLLDDRDGIIAKALTIAKKNIDETLQSGLALLKTELTSETGLMATLKKQVLGNDDSILKQAIALLDDSLYHPENGIVPKLRRELTSQEKGILVDALKLFGKALNDEKEGVLAKAMELLKRKLSAEDGVLEEALRLLEHKLNGKGGVVENLQHRLMNEHDGALIQALNLLQAKLNDEKTGILSKTLGLLEKRLLAKDGILDTLEKKLTEEETGTLAQAIASMKKALEKKGGPLDLFDQRVQKLLADSLELIQRTCLDERDGLLAQTLELASKKLNAENGLLDTLSKRLNDPQDGIIAKAIETLNTKLLEENGPFDLLQKKLLDENEGLLAKAIDLLNHKLQETGGPLDTLQKKLIDKDGILDQVCNILQDRLTHADRGILVQAKRYLSEALNNGKDGILVQAIDVLNRKLHEKGGPIDLLDMRLTDKDTGILSRAAGILQEKLMAQGGFVDQLDERLTGQAHPLLTSSRKKLTELRKAIVDRDRPRIQKSSRELQQLLEQLTAQTAFVFNKKPLASEDQLLLNQLKTQLPNFYSNSPLEQGAMLALVEAAIATVNRYYGSYEGIAARTATILQDTISDAIEPLLTRVENMPKKMVDNLLGTTQTTADTENGGTISQFLDTGGSILKKMLEKGGEAIAKPALSAFGSLLILGIKLAHDNMDDTPALRLPKATLNNILGTLNSVRENGNWRDLYQCLVDASEALKPVKIYVSGFRVPKIGPQEGVQSSEGIYSENVNALQEAMDTAPREPENQNWEALAEGEKNKLVDNSTKFLTIKHIYEDICHLKPTDERFYMRLLKKANAVKDGDTDAELKKLFFEELEEKKIGIVKRLYARIQYFFYNSIVKKYTTLATDVYFKEIFNYIRRHKVENFDTFRNQITTNFTRYLTILGGAYEKVAENPSPTGTLNEMLQQELAKKESNLGFDPKELYLELAQIVLQKTLGKGFIGWLGKKFIGNPEEIVRSIIDKSLGSMQDARGYTHALNSVIREQLEEIWKLLQDNYARKQNNSTTETPELSNVKRSELSALVKNLFEILRKSKCQTKDELRDLIKGKLLSSKVNQAIDDLFIEEVIEKVTNLLAFSVQSLVKEDQLQKLTYKFANLVNRTFEVGEEVTLQQMQDEERKIAKLSGQILRLAVNTAVEEKFDFSGKKQQGETNRFITELHNRSRQFFTSTGGDLTALSTMDFSSPEGKNKIDKIIEETLAYESECYESSFQAKSSKVNSDNKDEIGARYLGIAEQSKPLVQAVSQLKQHSKTLENIQTVVPHLGQIKKIASAILVHLFPQGGATNEDLTFCENQLAILNTHLEELKKMRGCAALAEQIAAQIRIFATTIIDVRKTTQMNLFCIAQSQSGSLLEQIANEKKQSLCAITQNSALGNKLAMFKQEVFNSFDDVTRSQLLMKLGNIEEARIRQQIDTAQQEFIAICRQAMAQANSSIPTHRGKYHLAYQSITQAIDQTHLLEPNQDETARRGIRDSISLAQQHLEALANWESQHVQAVPFINFPVVDMKGLQDWASGLVCDRVQERLNGFIHFLKREETYRYGLLNHLLLVPYVQSVRANPKA